MAKDAHLTDEFFRAGELMELGEQADDFESLEDGGRQDRGRIAWLALAAASALALLVLAFVSA